METSDLLVIGGGPAGVSAALSAARAGLSVRLVDEAPAAGGQVYRALAAGLGPDDPAALGPDFAEGERLRAALAASGVDHRPGHRAILLAPGFRATALSGSGLVSFAAPSLVVATGATERIVPFPGWTEPGVFGLAAATIMIKAHRLLPGRNPVVAGCGPLLYAVAAAILKSGGRVAAVVDLAGPGDWLAALPALASRPDLLAQGARWMAAIKASGAPLHFRSAIVSAAGVGCVDRVAITRVDRDGKPRSHGSAIEVACDALLVGHGLVPNTDLTRSLRAAHRYEGDRGGWIAARDADMRTTIDGLYLAGDGGGISGAAAAALQGELAGLAVARDQGRLTLDAFKVEAHRVRAALSRAERFGRAMGRMMAMRPAVAAAIPADCVVCRCEDVTRAEIEHAVAAGARDVNQLKAWTRAGMGPCQGKMCGEAVAALVGAHVGGRAQAGAFAARPPFRPVPTDALIGTFDYADIPVPPPAPL
jgi:thioredoxin reductase/bacterioferritin-associated ferredoxin